jgi:hypothetical protein
MALLQIDGLDFGKNSKWIITGLAGEYEENVELITFFPRSVLQTPPWI